MGGDLTARLCFSMLVGLGKSPSFLVAQKLFPSSIFNVQSGDISLFSPRLDREFPGEALNP